MTDVLYDAATVYPSGAPGFTYGFLVGSVLLQSPLKPGMNSGTPDGGTRCANLVTKPVIMLLILPMRGLILSNLGCKLRCHRPEYLSSSPVLVGFVLLDL
jgi:hypothetical protein